MLDWYTWGEPFRSFWLNIYLNLGLGVAKAEFGTGPASYFIYMLALDWLWALPVLIFLIWRGAKNLPLPAIAALAILLTHTLISHKEFRFIFPAIALAIPLAGLGLSGLWLDMKSRGWLNTPRLCLGVFLLLGPMFSPYLYFMLQLQTGSFKTFEAVANQHLRLVSIEGLHLVFGSEKPSFLPMDILFPASTRLTRQTIVSGPAGLTEADAIIASQDTPNIPPAFHVQSCVKGNWIPLASTPQPNLCIWLRHPGADSTETVLPFEFPFPPNAKPFMVKDRLLDP
jgi:hypothetical protein